MLVSCFTYFPGLQQSPCSCAARPGRGAWPGGLRQPRQQQQPAVAPGEGCTRVSLLAVTRKGNEN